MSSSSQDKTPREPGWEPGRERGREPGTAGAQAAAPPREAHEAERQYVPRQAPQYEDTTALRREEREGAVAAPARAALGVTFAAAVLLMVSGAWNILEGIAAIIRGTFFIVMPTYVYTLSAAGWGVFHLVLGVVVFLVGACLFLDKLWARAAGVAIASISAVINFLYIPYQPIWSLVLIGLDVAVIWALLASRHHHRQYA
jgi:hypothetical protein